MTNNVSHNFIIHYSSLALVALAADESWKNEARSRPFSQGWLSWLFTFPNVNVIDEQFLPHRRISTLLLQWKNARDLLSYDSTLYIQIFSLCAELPVLNWKLERVRQVDVVRQPKLAINWKTVPVHSSICVVRASPETFRVFSSCLVVAFEGRRYISDIS